MNPGNIGSQNVSPRNSIVADKPSISGKPMLLSDITAAASKVPRPPGMIAIVRNIVEIMRLTKTPSIGATTPSARTTTQNVAASNMKVITWQANTLRYTPMSGTDQTCERIIESSKHAIFR